MKKNDTVLRELLKKIIFMKKNNTVLREFIEKNYFRVF